MSGQVILLPTDDAGVTRVVIRNPGKLNALSVAMWHELRAIFDGLNAAADTPRVLLSVWRRAGRSCRKAQLALLER